MYTTLIHGYNIQTGYGSINSLIVTKNDNQFEMQWDHLNVKGKCFTAKIC